MLFSQWLQMLEGSRAYNKNSRSVVPVLSVCSDTDSDSDSCQSPLQSPLLSGRSLTRCDSKACDFAVILGDFARAAISDSLLTGNVGRPSTALSSVKAHGQEEPAGEGASGTAAARPAAAGPRSGEEGKEEGGETVRRRCGGGACTGKFIV